MDHVLNFVKWGLTHVKKDSVPEGAILPIDRSLVGSAGEWEYLLGSTGYVATQSLLDRNYKKYYKGDWTRAEFDRATAGWVKRKQIVCDCQGVEDYYSKSDTNADSNYRKYCTSKGLCSAINRPYVIGEAVFNGSSSDKSHVGWVCGFMPDGDVLVMEERGLSYGFVITQMSKRAWKYRGLMTKRYKYNGVDSQPKTEATGFVFSRLLKYGCVGDDVKELKKALAAKGYGGLTLTNGNFYGSTRTKVKAFQRDHGLSVDGVAGPKTYAALDVKYKV